MIVITIICLAARKGDQNAVNDATTVRARLSATVNGGRYARYCATVRFTIGVSWTTAFAGLNGATGLTK